MTHHDRSTGLDNPQRLVWVVVIAATAGFLTSVVRLDSLLSALVFAAGAALISVLVVLLWDRFRGATRH
jgi:hypothetical protein